MNYKSPLFYQSWNAEASTKKSITYTPTFESIEPRKSTLIHAATGVTDGLSSRWLHNVIVSSLASRSFNIPRRSTNREQWMPVYSVKRDERMVSLSSGIIIFHCWVGMTWYIIICSGYRMPVVRRLLVRKCDIALL